MVQLPALEIITTIMATPGRGPKPMKRSTLAADVRVDGPARHVAGLDIGSRGGVRERSVHEPRRQPAGDGGDGAQCIQRRLLPGRPERRADLPDAAGGVELAGRD